MSIEAVARLPITMAPDEMEDGMSLLFRAFRANGMSLAKARSWLGLKSFEDLSPRDVSLLAWTVSVSSDWLVTHLPLRAGRGKGVAYRWAGSAWMASSLRLSSTVGVCPECLRVRGRAQLPWRLRTVCVCAEHGIPLVDHCKHCQGVVRWDRPAMDVCHCGRYLTSETPSEAPSRPLLAWACWMAWRLGSGARPDELPHATQIPRILQPLSVDGANRLVVAFGLLESDFDPPKRAQARCRSITGMAPLVTRGLERLRQLDGGLDALPTVAGSVHWPLVQRMKLDGVSPADWECAGLLLAAHHGHVKLTADGRGNQPRGQLFLFDPLA